MTARYLITTADRRTWGTSNAVLFLGEWCKVYSDSEYWESLDHATAKYHWDDPEKFDKDYAYLETCYLLFLDRLTEVLNLHHNVKWSRRRWEITIGYWLRVFIQVTYDRWCCVTSAESYNVSGTTVIQTDVEDLTPGSYAEFISLVAEDDYWNHYIFSAIIRYRRNIEISELIDVLSDHNDDQTESSVDGVGNNGGNDGKGIPFKDNLINATRHAALSRRPVTQGSELGGVHTKGAVERLKTWMTRNIRLNYRKKPVFFWSGYLGMQQIRLELALRQVRLRTPSPPRLPEYNYDSSRRENIRVGVESSYEFEKFLGTFIPENLPKCYVEGFSEMTAICNQMPWPKEPRIIFTANGHIEDEVFKAWVGQKIECGTKLYIGQYGGGFGSQKSKTLEDHDLAICDKYFSWGWTGREKIVPLPSPRLTAAQRNHVRNESGGLLLVQTCLPRYTYYTGSYPLGPHMETYFDEQFEFVENLSEEVRTKSMVRLYPHDYSLCVQARWRDRVPDISFDDGNKSVIEELNSHRLFVGTNNSTTIIEALIISKPTIIFWNFNHWRQRPSSIPDFDELQRVGVLFSDPKNAATQINIIWDNLDEWWMEEERQRVIREFCNKYAKTSRRWLEDWKKQFDLTQ